jgi:hypothetical protein
MKHLIAPFVFVTLFCSSCTKEVIPLTAPIRSSSSISTSASENAVIVGKNRYQYDLTEPQWSEFNSCTGELIKIRTGIWRIQGTFITIGNRMVYQFHTNTSGYKLYNATTGVEYVGSYSSNTVFTVYETAEVFSVAYTETLSVLLTTPGGGNNSILKADFHFTLNANGIETAFVDNFRSGCQ